MKLWHDHCNRARYNTSISNDSEINVLTKSEYCFCLISVARKVTSTPPQEFDVPESRTCHGRYVSQTTNTRWKQVTRCVGHGIALLSRVRGDFQPTSLALRRVRGGTKQRLSARKTQTRIRTAQSARILELQIERDFLEFLAEFTRRARCEVTKRTTPEGEVRMECDKTEHFS